MILIVKMIQARRLVREEHLLTVSGSGRRLHEERWLFEMSNAICFPFSVGVSGPLCIQGAWGFIISNGVHMMPAFWAYTYIQHHNDMLGIED